MRILLAEDDPLLGDGLQAGPRQLAFAVDWVRDGAAAERQLLAAGKGADSVYAAAAHELRTPIAAIRAQAQVALGGLQVQADWPLSM